MNITVLGIDLAKSVFQLHGADASGKALLKKRLSRSQLLPFIANLPQCTIAMEACHGAHYWARQFQMHGHKVLLISPQFVKPYVKSNKNDAADAEAICEAATRDHMRFVPIKSVEQQDIQSIHRIRDRLVGARTSLANEIRGLLGERGIIIAKAMTRLRRELPDLLAHAKEDNSSEISPRFIRMLETLWEELRTIDGQIKWYDIQILELHEASDMSQKLEGIPGIGPMAATALLASVGDPRTFKNGRQMSAWLGLVPRQASSGGKERLLGISKRGDVYLRKILIHGARSALLWAGSKEDRRSRWAVETQKRRGTNRAAVALANKNVRVAWAILSTGKAYETVPAKVGT